MTKHKTDVSIKRIKRFDDFVKTLRREDAWGAKLKAVRVSEALNVPIDSAKELIVAMIDFNAAKNR